MSDETADVRTDGSHIYIMVKVFFFCGWEGYGCHAHDSGGTCVRQVNGFG